MILKRIRVVFALIFLLLITSLFLDFTGTLQPWFGWMARLQFLPALFSLNIIALLIIVALTLICGRVYCSVICPLGVMQDIFGWMGKRIKKNRYRYSGALTVLRLIMLGVLALSVILGIGAIVALLAPYSSYGRICQTLLAPAWQWGNNILAGWSEEAGNYDFYMVDLWLRSPWTLGVAVVTLVVLAILAWRNGRTYCNTICPVGTILGYLSQFSLLKPVIDTTKCNSCGLCGRNCKASCIDSKNHAIDFTRCVSCMDCLTKCHKHAISYTLSHKRVNVDADSLTATPDVKAAVKGVTEKPVDTSRRAFITTGVTLAGAAMAHAKVKSVDGGLAVIADKKIPERTTPIVPPGAKGLANLSRHCTACQLCVSVCPNGVLRPSSRLENLLQPECSYERGCCRPECTACSDICPTGAICRIGKDNKSSIQIGHAVWVKDNCVVLTDEVSCGNCARHCPVGAIQMIPSVAGDEESLKIPMVDTERCIGCGACENLCPSRPFSAIYVEGHERHRTI